MAKNVLGTDLEECGRDPLTGYYRDGCCNTGPGDMGVHTVCAVVTDEFLEFSKISKCWAMFCVVAWSVLTALWQARIRFRSWNSVHRERNPL